MDPNTPEAVRTPHPSELSPTEYLIGELANRISALEARLTAFIETAERKLEVNRSDLSTVYQDLQRLQRDFTSRFGSQVNCPHCHRKLDSVAAQKPACPICGGRLRP